MNVFKNLTLFVQNKKLFKNVMIILFLILLLSMISTFIFDDTNFDFIFRLMGLSIQILCILLLGARELFANQNKALGYFCFFLSFIFICFIFSIFLQ